MYHSPDRYRPALRLRAGSGRQNGIFKAVGEQGAKLRVTYGV